MQVAPIILSIVFQFVTISCILFWVLEVWFVEKKLALVKPSSSTNQPHRIIQFLYHQRQNHPYWHSAMLCLPLLVGATAALIADFLDPWLDIYESSIDFVENTIYYAFAIAIIWYNGREYARKSLKPPVNNIAT